MELRRDYKDISKLIVINTVREQNLDIFYVPNVFLENFLKNGWTDRYIYEVAIEGIRFLQKLSSK